VQSCEKTSLRKWTRYIETHNKTVFKNAVSIHTAGWRTKTRYVNTCIYVDSLRLLAATPPAGVVAQLVVRWVAVLRFQGSRFESQ